MYNYLNSVCENVFRVKVVRSGTERRTKKQRITFSPIEVNIKIISICTKQKW